MKNFKVLIRGTGYHLVVNGVAGTYGFNCARFVHAETEEAARQLALSEVADKLREYPSPERQASFAVKEAVEWSEVVADPGLAWFKL